MGVVVVVSSEVLRLAHLTVPTMSLKRRSMKIDSWRARSEMAMTAAPPFLLVQNGSRIIGEVIGGLVRASLAMAKYERGRDKESCSDSDGDEDSETVLKEVEGNGAMSYFT